MSYNGDLELYLFFAPVVCCLSFALALLVHRERTKAHVYLAVNFIVCGMGMFACLLTDRYDPQVSNTMRPWDMISIACAGATILFYFISLMQPHLLTRCFIIRYSSFALAYSALVLLFDRILPEGSPFAVNGMFATMSLGQIIYRLLAVSFIFFMEVYIAVVVICMYRRHRQFVYNNYSYSQQIDLRWIVYIIAFFTLLSVISLLGTIYTGNAVSIIYYFTTLISYIFIFYFGLRQQEIPLNGAQKDEPGSSDFGQEFLSSTGFIMSQQKIRGDLEVYFLKQKPYLNPNLSLGDVAIAIGTNTTYLSQLINREFNVNFYTFVNNYRIDYALLLIEEGVAGHSFDELSCQSGFKSRSTFYEKFRQRTGCSPKEYMSRKFISSQS